MVDRHLRSLARVALANTNLFRVGGGMMTQYVLAQRIYRAQWCGTSATRAARPVAPGCLFHGGENGGRGRSAAFYSTVRLLDEYECDDGTYPIVLNRLASNSIVHAGIAGKGF